MSSNGEKVRTIYIYNPSLKPSKSGFFLGVGSTWSLTLAAAKQHADRQCRRLTLGSEQITSCRRAQVKQDRQDEVEDSEGFCIFLLELLYSLKTNMTIDISTKFEDVSAIKNGDFSIDMLVFRSVHQPMHIGYSPGWWFRPSPRRKAESDRYPAESFPVGTTNSSHQSTIA